ncbi:uncharacterized protein VDAG_05813 [Verticillium dahliae VdLs.17]|uniref:Uncharacterized protein n=1 Tax=Verticillium dahliae (strain VdLs.17 / ATCC MYA-4575 / FGSC 10137) TaxID=498257 RepID=G2X6N1_VERDV|nr:uncharacterized protein VDAG_05813 [Verticillium dahliae VdLs.17]EGY14649.1 hypothetical protein VDAG_05813 [Verticillium dahliae VdLs.17]KAF3345823.1 Calcium/calmodulin-dependent protein kinase [Verticillium dahliae VDG2]
MYNESMAYNSMGHAPKQRRPQAATTGQIFSLSLSTPDSNKIRGPSQTPAHPTLTSEVSSKATIFAIAAGLRSGNGMWAVGAIRSGRQSATASCDGVAAL